MNGRCKDGMHHVKNRGNKLKEIPLAIYTIKDTSTLKRNCLPELCREGIVNRIWFLLFSDDKRNVTVTNIAVADGDEDFILTAVTFETHLLIFSVNVGLGIEQDSVKRDTVTESEDVCALLFVGKDDDIVLLANPVK